MGYIRVLNRTAHKITVPPPIGGVLLPWKATEFVYADVPALEQSRDLQRAIARGIISVETRVAKDISEMPHDYEAVREIELIQLRSQLEAMDVNLQQTIAALASVTSLVIGEIPTGDIDGTNTTFVTANEYLPFSVHLYRNGQRMKEGPGDDYVEGVDHKSFIIARAPRNGDVIIVDYLRRSNP